MSRASFLNDRYEFVFGVDHATGTFVQVWDLSLPDDEENKPVYTYDAQFGPHLVRLSEAAGVLTHNPKFAVWVRQIGNLYKANRESGKTNLGTEHVLELGEALGFERDRIKGKVYELWD